jgi:selenocysteine lyase/cysteine desulfurase
MIFNSQLYKNQTPDDPGGGTVDWTNPWGQHRFVSSIEAREDGGTPPFLQTIRAALAIRLKEEMNPEKIIQREEHLVKLIFDQLESIPRLHVLADNLRHRLGAISFYIEDLHYNLIVRLLNDHYGIQTRGGCSCAGTYGHYLLHVDPNRSKSITDKIDNGDLSEKPGWVRVSLHPTMSDDEVMFIADAIKQVVKNCEQWSADYSYDQHKNEFFHRDDRDIKTQIKKFFNL